jgi:hemerythrin
MALLTWSNDYSVGVKALDGQHTVLFNALNDLHDAMMKGQARTITAGLLEKLVKYTHEHFAAEEKMMAAAGYPELDRHRNRHLDLTKQVSEFVARHEKGEVTVNVHLMNFLRDWLTKHIQHEDKEYGPWLNRHGLK